MRKIFCAVLALALCLSLGGTALQADAFAGGSGTPTDPFIITTAAHLDTVRFELSSHHRLGGNITLAGNWVPIGTAATPFTGSFDGNGHSISGMSINSNIPALAVSLGLFGVTDNATIKNVGVTSVDIIVNNSATPAGGVIHFGGLVGHQRGGTISNSHTTGTIAVQHTNGNSFSIGIGGLVGRSDNGSITGSHSAVTTNLGVQRSFFFGGLVGILDTGNITSSHATGSFSSTFAPSAAGGLTGSAVVGISGTASIINSYATGDVTSGGPNLGGLVGQIAGSTTGTVTVSGSRAAGNVNGTNLLGVIALRSNYIGGLVGRIENRGIYIRDTHATGAVSGNNNVGGLVGGFRQDNVSFSGSITTSYATGNVSGVNNVGGLMGNMNPTGIDHGFSITDVYATGGVNGTTRVGGLLGTLNRGSVDRSYSTGSVTATGSDAGGLIGRLGRVEGWQSTNAGVARSYAIGNVNGAGQAGAVVGYQAAGSTITSSYRYVNLTVDGMPRAENTPAGIHGGILTMTQLQAQSTYESNNWLFNPIGPWALNNNAFPHLNVAGIVDGGPSDGPGSPGDGGGPGNGGSAPGGGGAGGGPDFGLVVIDGDGGRSSGCNAAAGLLAMLMVLPLLFKRKN